jgi:hypothetical protein
MRFLQRAAFACCLVALSLPVLSGCGSGNQVPAHTADEQKAVNDLNNMTPEQQIERIQKGPMPDSAKAAMIKKIKDENGLK